LFNYESPDERAINPQERYPQKKFKTNFFFAVSDKVIQNKQKKEITNYFFGCSRFNQLDDHNSNLRFLYNIKSHSKEPQNNSLNNV